MIGLGAGLTPDGDDVLSGFLVGLAQLPPAADGLRPFGAALGSLVTSRAAVATTALSATLLRHAARGEGAGVVVDVLAALGRNGSAPPMDQALPRLLAVGHSSGHRMAAGIAAAARVCVAGWPAGSGAGSG
jgi:Protein of unknown function (DUF2877)